MINQDTKQILIKARPFQYLDTKELDNLIQYCQVISFKANEVIYQQGKKSAGMYTLINGHALVTVKILGRDVINLASLSQGDFIGEISLIEKGISSATVVASEDTQCLLLTPNYFDMLGLFFPETKYKISRAITETVCERIKLLHENITSFMTKTTMAKRSFFSEVIQSLAKLNQITLPELGFDLNYLRKENIFTHFTPEEMTELFDHAELIHVEQNYTLINQNDTDSPFFIVLRGAVLASIITNNKIAKLVALGPLSFFGSISHIISSPSIITYTSCERAVILKITAAKLLDIQNNNVDLWYKLYDLICASFVKLERSANKLNVRLTSELYNYV